MNMQIAFANEVEAHRETFGARSNARQRRLCGFLHHVAEFSGERYAATSFNKSRFDLKNFAADLSPRQSCGESDLAVGRDALLAKLDWTKHLAHACGIDRVFRVFCGRFGNELARQFAATRTDLALEIANAGFASVVTNHFENAFVREVELVGLQSVALSLLRHEMSFGDLEFLAFGVTGKTQNLETVLQRRRDRVQHVRGGDEKDLRKIVLDVEIVILERVVLFRIEHFEQGSTWVAAEVRAKFVDFVEQQHRINRAGLLHHLDDLTGQSADVRATMSANLSFITHAA